MADVVISFPRDSSIFVLEDDENRIAWFQRKFGEKNVMHCATAYDAFIILPKKRFDGIFLDHDLGTDLVMGKFPGNGQDVARFMFENLITAGLIVIHSWNAQGAARMKSVLEKALVIPFGRFGADDYL